jgi:hypothetical protein
MSSFILPRAVLRSLLVLLLTSAAAQAVDRHLIPDAWKPAAPRQTIHDLSDAALEARADELTGLIEQYADGSQDVADGYRAKLRKVRQLQQNRADGRALAPENRPAPAPAPQRAVQWRVIPSTPPSSTNGAADIQKRLTEQQRQNDMRELQNKVQQMEWDRRMESMRR